MSATFKNSLRSILFAATVLCLTAFSNQASGQNLYSRQTGNWDGLFAWYTNAARTIAFVGTPGAGHTLNIGVNHVITFQSGSVATITGIVVNDNGGGGTFTVGNGAVAGTTLTISGDITVNAGGIFQSGATGATAHTVKLAGNLTNNNTFNLTANAATNQIFQFNSNTARTISGTGSFTFSVLTALTTLNSNINVNSSILVNSTLNFTNNGIFIVNASSNITLGPAASFGGVPSATKYIQLDGSTGANSSLIKTSSGAVASWQITYPIGTSAGGYTPVTLTTVTTNPTANSTLSVKAIYNLSNQGQMRRVFRFTVAGNASATTFTTGVFKYSNLTDISAGDAESNYTTEWYLATTVGTWNNIATIAAPTNQFTVAGGAVATASLATGTFYYTIGSSDAYPNAWYSYQTGVWSNWQNWTLDPSGTTLVNGLNLPPQPGDAIVILNGITITNDVSGQVASTTTINGGATLDMSSTSGNTLGTVSGTGTLRLNGINLPTGIYTSFVSTLGGTIEYYNTGGALSTTQTTYNNLLFTNTTASTITFVSANNLTINNNLSLLQNGGGGTVVWQINDNTNNQRTLTITGNLTVSASGKITVGTGNSGGTPHAMTIFGNITNSGIMRLFDDTGASPLTDPNYTSGAVYTTGTRGSAVNVTFSGTNDQTVTCNSQTDFYRFIVNKGTGQQAMVTVNSTAASNMRLFGPSNLFSTGGNISNCALSLSNGTVQLTGTLTIPILIVDGSAGPPTDVFGIPETAGLWLNSPNVSVTLTNNTATNDDQRLTVNGLFRVSNGSTFNSGFSRGIGSTNGGSVVVEGTNTTMNIWQYRPVSGGSGIFAYIQTGGTVNVGTTGYNGTPALAGVDDGVSGVTDQFARFSLAKATSSFQMSGGTLNIGSPTTPTPAGANTPLAGGLDIQSAAGNYNVTGGTVNVYIPQGATVSPASGSHNFGIYSTAPLYNVNIFRVGTNFAFTAVLNSSLTVLNDLTIQAGNNPTLVCSNNNLTIGGNFNNQAATTFTPGTNTITFNGSGAQTWTNSGTITSLNNVVVNKSAGTLTLAGSNLPTITSLTLTSGTLADGGTTVTATGLTNNATHSGAGSITFIGAGPIGGNNGTFGNLIITTNGTVAISGNQTVSGNLALSNGTSTILNIGFNSLTVLGNITAFAAFGTSYYIQASGFHNAGGLTRKPVANTDLLFPVGSGGLYTPNTINVLSATTFGTITVRPVNSEHPNVTTINQSVKYYWRVTSSGFVGIGPTVSHKSYIFSTATKSGVTTTYQAARYDRTANTWGTNNTQFSMTTSILPSPINTGTGWTGVVGDQLDGEYTCGNLSAFGAITVYYSRQTGPWNVNATWSTISVGNATPAASNPTSCPTCPVIIGDGISNNHTITTVASSSCGTLALTTGSTLDCSTFTGHNFGTNTGGAVTGRGTLRVAAVGAGVSTMFPAGDFTNFLGVTGGTVEWYGATKTLPITGPGPQNLSLASYYNLVLNPNAGNTITLPASNLTIYNDLVQGNQAGFTGTSLTNGTRTIAITRNLAITLGTFGFTNVAASATTMTVGGNTSIGTGATFGVVAGGSANTNTLTTPGSITNNGTISFTNTGTVDITFTGSSNVNFDGTGTVAAAPLGTTLHNVVLNKGTSQTPILNFSVGGTVTAATSGWLTLTNGTFDFQNAGPFTIVSTATTYTIPSTTKLKVSAGTVNILTNASNAADLLLNGTLEVAGGTVNIAGGTSGNDIEYASAGSPTIIVSSGVLNVNGSIRRSISTLTGALVYNQTGGAVTVGGNSSDNTRGVFEVDFNTGSSFTLTGASSLTVQRQTNGTGYADLFINPVTSSVSSTSTISVGLNAAVTQNNLRINITPSIGNFTVVGGGNAQTAGLFSNPMVLGGTFTITSPSSFVTNSLDVTIAGNLNITGTGTYIGGSAGSFNTTTFNGTGAQTATLSAGSTFNNMTVNKTTATTLALSGTAPTLNDLNILSGILDVGSLVLTVSGNITNNSIQISTPATGSIAFASASTVHTITSSNGSFNNLSLGVLTAAPATKLIVVNGNMTITGILNFTTFGTSRYLFIGSSLLTFGPLATITNAGSTRFIKSNGVTSDLGVSKNWPVGTTSFTYELGTRTNYTPVTISNLVTTTAGNYNVVAVDNAHPTSSPTGPQILNYYWKIVKDNTLVHNATGSLTVQAPTALVGGSGGILIGAYLDAINLIGWTAGGSFTSQSPNPTTVLLFSGSLNTVMPGPNGQFDYTFGTTTTLPNPITPVYSRFADADMISNPTTVGALGTGGSWAIATSWTLSNTGYGAALSSIPTNRPVVILPAARLNLDILGQSAFTTTISGLLVVTTVGHSIGAISGTGTMRTVTSTLPAGNYAIYTGSGGGTIEYVAPMVMNSRNTYNNLSVLSTSSGIVTMTNADLVLNGNLSIPAAGITLDNSINNRNISIAGNWSNSGTFATGTGTVTFNGSGAQSISGTTTFNNLTVSKSNSLTLSGVTTVSGVLTLTSGNIVSTVFPAASGLILPLSSSISGGSATSFIDGQVSKTLATGGTLAIPLGSVSASRYRPVTIGNTISTVSDVWTASYIGKNPTTDGFSNTAFNGANMSKVSQYEYWQVACSSGTSTASLTLSFGAGSYGGANIGILSSLKTVRWTGAQWDLPPGGGTFSQSGTNVAGTVTVSFQNAFSPQTLATDDPTSTLPIELLDFNAVLRGSAVDLNWSTASEVNNDFFTIERSADLEKFEEVRIVKGQGTKRTKTSYSSVDENPLSGRSYYRLRQTDLDGHYTFSDLKLIDNVTTNARLSIYPNPVMDSKFILEARNFRPSEGVVVSVVNLQGVTVFEALYNVDESGNMKRSVELGPVSNGLYAVIIISSSGLRTKVIIQ
jgi:fibronectin-binding autotransporter adhesin